MPVHLRSKARPGLAVQQIHQDKNQNSTMTRNKRRSNGSPQPTQPSRKRAAFGDITNALQSIQEFNRGKKGVKPPTKPPRTDQENRKPLQEPKKNGTKIFEKSQPTQEVPSITDAILTTSLSSSSSTTDVSSLGSSISSSVSEGVEYQLDDIMMLSPDSEGSPTKMQVEEMNQRNVEKNEEVDIKDKVAAISLDEPASTTCQTEEVSNQIEGMVEEDLIDIDQENKDDPNQSPEYAYEIFQYLKERESKFRISNYFETQPEVTHHMRAILMDWMVEVQENFELNHETLYLAAKLVDLYLTETEIKKDILQLVGATSLFISCKFDERCPPALEDFMYICDDAYNRHQFIKMEKKILMSIDFDLGIPLSYRFLRRYAKCVHASMETLTLARFILETSLMEHELITVSDSKLGAATLLLAFKMKQAGEWNATLVHQSGYKAEDLTSLVCFLNTMLKKPPVKQLQTVRTKYSHKVFYEVAKIPALDNL